jgi:hypothetical protein
MRNTLITNQLELFKKFAKSFYSEKDLDDTVPNSLKQYNVERLERHKQMIALDPFGEQFFFVVEMATKDGFPKIKEAHGLERALGFSEFSIEKYFECLSPIHLQVLTHFASEAVKIVYQVQQCNTQMKYVAQMPIRAYNGNFFLVKRILTAWEWTTDFKVKSYFNYFIITQQISKKQYEEMILNFKIDVEEGKVLRDDLMKSLMENKPDGILPFSEREKQVLQQYILQPNANAEAIGKVLKISRDTVLVHNKQLLSKAEDWLETKFKDARQLSDYLSRMSMI